MALVLWLAIGLLACIRYAPPEVVSADAPANRFSAERAGEFLERLYRDARPHPAGSNAAFRQRIVDEFRALGYQPQLQPAVSDRTHWRYQGEGPIPLTNILVPGPTSSPADPPDHTIILAGHFDSHPESPGAADDGIAVVAMLEIARMLRDSPQAVPGLLFLLTDGEEFGLLGAREFVRDRSSSALVINVEARGTSGPSLMFETSDDSGWLVDLFAHSAGKPFASSLFCEIYRYLPNDTDFTVFRDAGMRGMNFAIIGDVRNYHTPGDNIDNLDRRSLQHHGENVWNVLQNLRHADGVSPEEQAVYFDWCGWWIVRWPTSWSLWLAGLATFLGLVVWVGNPVALLSVATLRAGGMLLLSLIAAFAAAWLAQLALQLDGTLEYPWPVRPLPVILTVQGWSLAAVIGVGWLAGRTVNARTMQWAVFGFWTVGIWVTVGWLVGASYLFLVPVILGAGAGLAIRLFGRWYPGIDVQVVLAVTTAVAAGLLWLPLEPLFYDAIGFRMPVVMAGRTALLLTTLLPAVAATSGRNRALFFWILVVLATGLSVAAVVLNLNR